MHNVETTFLASEHASIVLGDDFDVINKEDCDE